MIECLILLGLLKARVWVAAFGSVASKTEGMRSPSLVNACQLTPLSCLAPALQVIFLPRDGTHRGTTPTDPSQGRQRSTKEQDRVARYLGQRESQWPSQWPEKMMLLLLIRKRGANRGDRERGGRGEQRPKSRRLIPRAPPLSVLFPHCPSPVARIIQHGILGREWLQDEDGISLPRSSSPQLPAPCPSTLGRVAPCSSSSSSLGGVGRRIWLLTGSWRVGAIDIRMPIWP